MNGVVANLRSLGVLAGRESRGRFWPYAGCVIALAFVGLSVVMVQVMNGLFGEAAQPDFGVIIIGIGAVVTAAVVLLAAAVCRRLHDSGLAGWWGLLPLPFLAAGIAVMGRVVASFTSGEQPNMALALTLILNNLAYLAALGTLVLLLCRAGTPGPNRYGQASDA